MHSDSTTPVDAAPFEDEPVEAFSAGPDGPVYRGWRALELATGDIPFEGVAELLWTGAEPRRAWWPTQVQPGPALRRLPPSPDVSGLLRFALAAMALDDPHRVELGAKDDLARARRVLPLLAVIVAGSFDRRRLPVAREGRTIADRLCLGLGVSTDQAPHIDRALVLCAAHDMSPAEHAVRAAARAGVDLYGCLAVGFGTRSGNGTGPACLAIEKFAEDVGSPRWAPDVVGEHLMTGEGGAVPGFGHPRYPKGDPRASALLDMALRLAPESDQVRTLQAIAASMAAAGQPPPRLAFGLVALSRALGLPPGSGGALFSIGRLAARVTLIAQERPARSPSMGGARNST